MFTGIIEGIGKIQNVSHLKHHTRLSIQSPFSLSGGKVGDSMAVDGCCLTMTSLKGKTFSADISPETLKKTTLGGLKKGDAINLERPLRVGDRLGGHLVQGHVDGMGRIYSSKLIKGGQESYYLIKVQIPKSLKIYMIPKGSVTIDGISLTINKVSSSKISLCIIPHTQSKTTLTAKKAGDRVNLEADMVLKFIEQRINSLSLRERVSVGRVRGQKVDR